MKAKLLTFRAAAVVAAGALLFAANANGTVPRPATTLVVGVEPRGGLSHTYEVDSVMSPDAHLPEARRADRH